MPTVLREGPYRLYFYSNEGHEPPHVHVDRDNRSAKFWVGPVVVAVNHGFRASELTSLYRIVREHEDEILERWHEHFA